MPLLSLQIHLTTMLKGQHARLKATFETVGAIPPYTLRLRRKESFCTSVCVLRALARTQNTHTCTTTCGRRRRPICTGVLPLQFEKPYNKYKMVLPVDV